MTAEKAIEILSDVGDINRCCAEDTEALDMAIKALETQPCEDCISREAVDEYITNLLSGYLHDEERTRLEDLTAYIWELPSVQPTRPKGRWIDIQYFEADDTYYRPKCPFCNAEPKEYSKFCPNCGADMTELESS